MSMTTMERLVAWVWDNIPGGVPMQLWVWGHAPRIADFCEELAHLRDAERSAS